MKPVPVLMYHHVNNHKGDMVTVTPETFRGQMQYLHGSGYKTLKADELLSYIKGELVLDERAVFVTFDDGWLDNYIYAFPVLKEYRINAAIFLITDRVENASLRNPELQTINSKLTIPSHKESKSLIENSEEYRVVLNWKIVDEMSGSGLIEFYSHTKSHARCNKLPEEALAEELAGSRRIIEEKTGKPCFCLCWPYGKYNDNAVRIAGTLNYRALFTTKLGVVKPGSDPFEIKRIVVKDSVIWFKRRLAIYSNLVLSELYLRLKKR
jgi:peptidoglycan/xylan/chitin deacetylase (PgdA/CDA1 family)